MTTATKKSPTKKSPTKKSPTKKPPLVPPELMAVATIHPHPRNPKGRRLSADSINELAADIQRHGVQQAIKVRVAPDHWGLPQGHVQIVFGERRWRACKKAGVRLIPVVMEADCDDARALELMGVENGQRADLDPIAKAHQLQDLTTPQPDGSRAMTQAEAGKIYRVTQSEVANLIRMLQLPPTFQAAVQAGSLPSANARVLLKYKDAPALLQALEQDFQRRTSKHWEAGRHNYLETRADVEDYLERRVRGLTRPMATKAGGHVYRPDQVRKFKLPDPDTLALLQVVTVEGQERALNVKLWDQLQTEPWEAFLKQRDARETARRSGRSTTGPKDTLSQKQLAQRDKELKAQRATARREVLGRFRERMLRVQIARELTENNWEADALLPYLMAEVRSPRGNRPDLYPLLQVAILGKSIRGGRQMTSATWREFHAVQLSESPGSNPDPVVKNAAIVKLILWPVVSGQDGGGLVDCATIPTFPLYSRTNVPKLTEEILVLPEQLVKDLAKQFHLDLAKAWKASSAPGTPERLLVEQLLDWLRKDELEALAQDVGVDLAAGKGREAADTAGKMRERILESHGSAKRLKLPKLIGSVR